MIFIYRPAHFLVRLFQQLEKQPSLGPEFRSCVNILRRAGYPRQALRLAQLTGNQADCIRIQTEDLHDATAVLRNIRELQFEQVSPAPNRRSLVTRAELGRRTTRAFIFFYWNLFPFVLNRPNSDIDSLFKAASNVNDWKIFSGFLIGNLLLFPLGLLIIFLREKP